MYIVLRHSVSSQIIMCDLWFSVVELTFVVVPVLLRK